MTTAFELKANADGQRALRDFGTQMDGHRELRKMTRERLAMLAGLSERDIRRVLSGIDVITVGELGRIAAALNMRLKIEMVNGD